MDGIETPLDGSEAIRPRLLLIASTAVVGVAVGAAELPLICPRLSEIRASISAIEGMAT